MREGILRYRITDYDRRLIPNPLIARLDDGARDREAWTATTGWSIGHPGWGLVYHLVLTLLDPDATNVVIETGTNYGSTSIVIAQAIVDAGRHCEFHTIELDPDVHAIARQRFVEAGVDHVITDHVGDSLQVLPELVLGFDRIDVAFLDGNHLHDHVMSEFDYLVDRLRPDGAVIMDNTWLIAEAGEDPRVNGALRTILDRYGGHLVNLPFCSWHTPGIALWQKQAFSDMTPPAADSWPRR